ncbi:MAG: hypothetical protein Q9219_001577 [cf. Caloplaca sp. 3 TL-2023]
MQLPLLLPLTSLLSLSLALPSTTAPSISVDVFDETACKIPTVRGYSFTQNNICKQFIKAEGSITATSLSGPVKNGCVLRVSADTSCGDFLGNVTVNGQCQATKPFPASSGKLVGC